MKNRKEENSFDIFNIDLTESLSNEDDEVVKEDIRDIYDESDMPEKNDQTDIPTDSETDEDYNDDPDTGAFTNEGSGRVLSRFIEFFELNKKRLVVIGLSAVIIVILCFAGSTVVSHSHYSNYEVLSTKDMVETVSEYSPFADGVVIYSGDGVSFLDSSLKSIWNYPISFVSPHYDSCGDYFIIYDRDAMQIAVFDKDGNAGTFSCNKAISKAKCSGNGCVAVMMSDESGDILDYYDSAGNKIAEISFDNQSQGYPMDFDVKSDGTGLAVSTENIGENGPEALLLYYDLSDDISGTSASASVLLEEKIIPIVQYMENGNIAAFYEDGFSIYGYDGELNRVNDTEFEKDVVSAFMDDENLGVIFEGEDSLYEFNIYNSSGKKTANAGFDHTYGDAALYGDKVIISSMSQFSIFTCGGNLKLSGGSEDENIHKVIELGGNKYILIKQNSLELIRGTGFAL